LDEIIYCTFKLFHLFLSFVLLVKLFACIRKKDLRRTLLIFSVILTYLIVSFNLIGTDVNLISSGREPKFSFPIMYVKDGGSTQYLGLGYGIFKINSLSEGIINEQRVHGVDKGYKLQVMFIPIKTVSTFVADN
jgi:hypothetical protein